MQHIVAIARANIIRADRCTDLMHDPRMSSEPYSAHEVGRRIALIRRISGKSQSQFAEAIGTSRGDVAGWEVGQRRPGISRANEIKRSFPGITLDWLFLDDPGGLSMEWAQAISAARRQEAEVDRSASGAAQGVEQPRG